MARLDTLTSIFLISSSPFVLAQSKKIAFEELGSFPEGTVSFHPDAQAVSSNGSVVVGASTVGMGDSRVQSIYDGTLGGGMSKTLMLDASILSAGVYIIRTTGEDFVETQNITIVR